MVRSLGKGTLANAMKKKIVGYIPYGSFEDPRSVLLGGEGEGGCFCLFFLLVF